jgi:hypothetical protein
MNLVPAGAGLERRGGLGEVKGDRVLGWSSAKLEDDEDGLARRRLRVGGRTKSAAANPAPFQPLS